MQSGRVGSGRSERRAPSEAVCTHIRGRVRSVMCGRQWVVHGGRWAGRTSWLLFLTVHNLEGDRGECDVLVGGVTERVAQRHFLGSSRAKGRKGQCVRVEVQDHVQEAGLRFCIRARVRCDEGAIRCHASRVCAAGIANVL